MTPEDRAEMVRQCRFEIKQKRFAAERPRARGRGDGNPYNNPEPTRGDNARDYVNAGGGDGDIYDRAARWDRHRATRVAKGRRRATPRAERDEPNGYVGYTGDWQAYFGGTQRARRRGAVSRRTGVMKR